MNSGNELSELKDTGLRSEPMREALVSLLSQPNNLKTGEAPTSRMILIASNGRGDGDIIGLKKEAKSCRDGGHKRSCRPVMWL